MDVGNVSGSEGEQRLGERGRNPEEHEVPQLWIHGAHCQGLSREGQRQGQREDGEKGYTKGKSKAGNGKGCGKFGG